MKFMRSTTGYSSLDHRRNEDVLEELKVDPVEKKLAQYKQKWLNHVSRTEDIRYPEQFLNNRPIVRYPEQFLNNRSIERRRPGRQLKGLLEGYSRKIETDHLLA
jgi:hypothetical protein